MNNQPPIPDNTVVHTPTEAEAKELLAILHKKGYRWVNTELLTENSYFNINKDNTCYCVDSLNVSIGRKEYFMSKCNSILTLTEFKERYCETKTPQPKFNIGDPVIITADCHVKGHTGTITYHNPANGLYTINQLYLFNECDLSPASEPETKPTDYMEAKELNLCELLSGHEGEMIFLTTMGNVFLESVSEINIRFKPHKTAKDSYLLNATGKMSASGEVLAYPSRALYEQYPLDPYTAWITWEAEQKKYALSVAYVGNGISGKNTLAHFLTPADRDKCTDVIDAFLSQIQQSKSIASLCEEIKSIIKKYSKQ